MVRFIYPHEPIYRRAEGSTYLEPDMMYVSSELRERMGSKRTSADIVFEFLSRSTTVYDRTTKADAYLALGVRELWLVDPLTVTIEVRHAGKVDEDTSLGDLSNTHAASTPNRAYSPVGKFQLMKSLRISSKRNQFRPCSVAFDV